MVKRKSEEKQQAEKSEACEHFYLHMSSCLSENSVGSPQKTGTYSCYLQGSNTAADKT